MKRVAPRSVAVGLLRALGAVERGYVHDASFGCKVLLCAAASASGWSGIPYCVPVMKALFHQLAKGGGWPSCSEGNASALGYEPFQVCPAGLAPVQSGPDGAGDVSEVPNGNFCADLSKPQQGLRWRRRRMQHDVLHDGAGSAQRSLLRRHQYRERHATLLLLAAGLLR
jgi:hypothetical protein